MLVGSFRFRVADDAWEWSAAVARMHGYEPGSVVPTTELLLSHKHPDDKSHVAAILDNVRAHGAPFSSRHRIIDTEGETHRVVVVGDRLLDDGGKVIGTFGFYIDLTDAFESEVQESVDDVVAEIASSRSAIEQAKGALMLAYGISADRAFEVLTWRSQETNVKVRDVARALLRDIATKLDTPQGFREDFNHILLTPTDRADRRSVR
ncbi:PAS and ANTAR domain-containing protein [Rhodococcus daqingensis]|uniref:PAS and ANTAR domain-containing protein n=1 Tax=Rhodococcus daqingensis TaxID=2479363 RepID=A0ABW2S2C4_9NOCA